MKTRWRNRTPPQIRFGPEVDAILETLPKTGSFFPYLATGQPGDRATEFKQRCARLGIKGVTLHSYRYAWVERAKMAGLSRTIRANGFGAQQQGVGAGLFHVKVPAGQAPLKLSKPTRTPAFFVKTGIKRNAATGTHWSSLIKRSSIRQIARDRDHSEMVRDKQVSTPRRNT